MTRTVITLNGRAVHADVEPRLSLADFIREHQGLTGTLTCNAYGDCADPKIAVSEIIDGAFVIFWPPLGE